MGRKGRASSGHTGGKARRPVWPELQVSRLEAGKIELEMWVEPKHGNP